MILPFTTVFSLAMRPFHTRYCPCLAVSLLFSCGDDGMTFLSFFFQGYSVVSLRYDWPDFRRIKATIMDVSLQGSSKEQE